MVTLHVATTAPSVVLTPMLVVPSFTAVTDPSDTVAVASSSLNHSYAVSAGTAVAVIVFSPPTFNAKVACDKVRVGSGITLLVQL